MNSKRSYKQYPKAFKDDAVALVLEQGYSVPAAAKSLGITAGMLYKWKELHDQHAEGFLLTPKPNIYNGSNIKNESE
jgi:transposase